VLIPLTDVTLDLGPTKVLPGSHRWSHLRCALTLLANSGVRCHVPVGSAVVLDGRTLHGACPNRGQTNREIQIFFYHREPSRPLLFGKEEL